MPSQRNLEMVQRYTGRRRRLMEQMGEGIALIGSPGVSPDPFLLDKNLRYLTGQTSRKAYLLLAPQGVRVQRWETIQGPELGRGRIVKEILFLEERTARERFLDGEGSGPDERQQASGIELVLPLSRLNETLNDNLLSETVLWANIATCPRLEQPLAPDLAFLNQIRERFIWLQIRNIAPLIHEMRRIKDPYEVECLRRAFQVHAEIYEKIMRTLKPGDNESLGEAIWHYEAKARYDPTAVSAEALDLYGRQIIVAAGKNTAIAHYLANNQPIRDGDLVLIDAGIDYAGYSSDITRTFPASGRFSPRQRELYEVVLEAQRQAIATMGPGSTNHDAHRAAYEVFVRHGIDRYGYGTMGHPVGLNIHDSNGWGSWEMDQPFEPGVVIVIEPFISIPEEGIGIRIEDGVLITGDGREVLPAPPKEADEVEALCRREG